MGETLAELMPALMAGFELGRSYSVMVAVVAAAVSAGLAGRRKAGHEATAAAVGVLAVGWLAGDGLRVLARARDLVDGAGTLLGPPAPLWAEWTVLATWAALGLLVGYVAAAWAGAFVGRRVTRGTGWMAAVAVSLAASGAVAFATGAAASLPHW